MRRSTLPALGGGTRDHRPDPVGDGAGPLSSNSRRSSPGWSKKALRARVEMSPRAVQQAPFRVLVGANMPAALVEIGYLSNPEQEQQLASAALSGPDRGIAARRAHQVPHPAGPHAPRDDPSCAHGSGRPRGRRGVRLAGDDRARAPAARARGAAGRAGGRSAGRRAAAQGTATEGPKIKATLFFASEDGQRLVGVEQDVPLAEGTVAQARALIEALLSVPAPAPYSSTVPAGHHAPRPLRLGPLRGVRRSRRHGPHQASRRLDAGAAHGLQRREHAAGQPADDDRKCRS